jgi:hypothetical protein
METTSRGQRSALRLFLWIALAVVSGAAVYVLVVTVFYKPHAAPPPALRQAGSQVLLGRPNALRPGPGEPGGPPGPPYVKQPTCFGLSKPPFLTVGQQADLELDIYPCPGSDLPMGIYTAQATSVDVALAGPVESQTARGPSWAWKATANAPGEHRVSISLNVAGFLQPLVDAPINAQNASNGPSRLLKKISNAISNATTTLKQIAGLLGAITTLAGAAAPFVVAKRRKGNKTGPDQAAGPQATGANVSAGDDQAGKPGEHTSE